MSNNHHLTVAAIVHLDGKYLCVEERSSQGIVINQPAGHVEQGETLISACIRETKEETCWHVKPTAFLGLYTYNPPQPKESYFRMAFIAEPIGFDKTLSLDKGIIRCLWMTANEIKQCDNLRSPAVWKCVKDHQQGQSHPLEIIYEFC